MNKTQTIEAAYLAGFEPSNDNLTEHQLFCEAMEFMLYSTIRKARTAQINSGASRVEAASVVRRLV